MKYIIIICCVALIISCESKVKTTPTHTDSVHAGGVLDTLENNINKGWDSVKAKVKKGSESINVNGDTLKKQIGESLREGSQQVKKGADSLKSKIDKAFDRTFSNKSDTLKK